MDEDIHSHPLAFQPLRYLQYLQYNWNQKMIENKITQKNLL